MVDLSRLHEFCNQLLNIQEFEDYCPNGLQVESGEKVCRLATGVTACQALIDAAVAWQADALLVHHGYFWKGEAPYIRGIKGQRIGTLMRNGISMLAYHLPLDSHPELGNNRQLSQRLGLEAVEPVGQGGLVWQGRLVAPLSAGGLGRLLVERLGQEPQHLPGGPEPIHRLAWCTGAAQGFIDQAATLGVDAYISGEVSEQTAHQARELGIHYFAAGHHATERYGVQALGQRLAREFGIEHRFIEIPNPV
jgi:dinuclear metal center YbgI/SA1388 family protein